MCLAQNTYNNEEIYLYLYLYGLGSVWCYVRIKDF